MNNKRGIIQTQLYWVFVLVVGALILLFFVGFINTQKQNAEERIALNIAKDLNAIITQTSVSMVKSDVLSIPNKQIEFSCDHEACTLDGCTSEFSISGISWATLIQVIFSPDLIQGTSLISWSLDWNMPYHATNFIYLTSPGVRYIFVNNNNFMSQLYYEFPEVVTKEIVNSIDSITNKNNYKVRIIYYGTSDPSFPQALRNMPDSSVTAVTINQPISSEEVGAVSFYKKEGAIFTKKHDSSYVGKPSLYGAIFSEDKNLYECNMKKAMLRLYLVTLAYDKAIMNYKTNTGLSNNCKEKYDSSAISYIGQKSKALELLQEAGGIQKEATKIREMNHNLKLSSCPILY